MESKILPVLDYYPGGDPFHYLHERGFLTEDEAQLILAEMVLRVQHLHEL
jgi:serine/threonine protein kinase